MADKRADKVVVPIDGDFSEAEKKLQEFVARTGTAVKAALSAAVAEFASSPIELKATVKLSVEQPGPVEVPTKAVDLKVNPVLPVDVPVKSTGAPKPTSKPGRPRPYSAAEKDNVYHNNPVLQARRGIDIEAADARRRIEQQRQTADPQVIKERLKLENDLADATRRTNEAYALANMSERIRLENELAASRREIGEKRAITGAGADAKEAEEDRLSKRKIEYARDEVQYGRTLATTKRMVPVTSKVFDVVGKAQRQGFTPQDAGSVTTGVMELMGSKLAGPVGTAVTLVAEGIKLPFQALANSATMAAERLSALASPLGVVNQGYVDQIQMLNQIPIIGESLAKVKEAERKELETVIGFAAKWNPAMSSLLQQATDDMQAVIGRMNKDKVQGGIDANRLSGDILATAEKQFDAKEFRKNEKEFNESTVAFHTPWESNAESKQLDIFRLKAEIAKKSASVEGLSPDDEKRFRARAQEILGVNKLESSVGAAARPAQMSSALEYQRQLQLRAYSGPSTEEKNAATLTDLLRTVKAGVAMIAGKSAGESVQTLIDAFNRFRRK